MWDTQKILQSILVKHEKIMNGVLLRIVVYIREYVWKNLWTSFKNELFGKIILLETKPICLK